MVRGKAVPRTKVPWYASRWGGGGSVRGAVRILAIVELGESNAGLPAVAYKPNPFSSRYYLSPAFEIYIMIKEILC